MNETWQTWRRKHSCMDENRKFKKSYRKWSSMCRRCFDPQHPAFKYYGGKGITVDSHWTGKDGYSNFVDDMGEPPEGLTLERIDREKNYGPGNCRWATWKEQAQNRSKGSCKNVKKDSIRQKALAAGLPYQVVYVRIKKLGWDEQTALTTPVQTRTPSYYQSFLKREKLQADKESNQPPDNQTESL